MAAGIAALAWCGGAASQGAAVSGAGSVGAPAPWAPDDAGYGWGLPFFDARLDASGAPLPRVRAAVERARTPAAVAARGASIAELAGSVPGLAVDDDPLLGTPRFVRSTAAMLTGAAPGVDLREVVRGFVAGRAALLEIDAKELDLARPVRDFVTAHSGVRHFTWQQTAARADGGGRIDVFGGEVRASVGPDGRLINISSTMVPGPGGAGLTVGAPTVEDDRAVVAAASNLGVALRAWPVPEAGEAGAPAGGSMARAWRVDAALRGPPGDDPLTTELVAFPLDRETLRPAWLVVMSPAGVGHTYEIVVDAVDGSVLWRHDRLVWDTTQPVTLRVYAGDSPAPGSPGTPTPSGAQPAWSARSLVTVGPADVRPWSPNGWINDGGQTTYGNNVQAQLDLNGDNQPDLPRPPGGPSRTFDFPLDPAQDPSTYRDASVVQMFYRANFFHDRLMALGFDEAAGNFQTLNFSGRGAGNDAVAADVQDSGGLTAVPTNRNNANFATGGRDGSAARVQMYLFDGPSPDRDGALEGDIVYHELAHGVSTRLHGGLTGTQPRGMGEGWSDFFGLALLAEPGDPPDGVYPCGPYATYQLGTPLFNTNYYFGIRRYPYCTDPARNPSTFAHIDPSRFAAPAGVPASPVLSDPPGESHGIGQVWCSMLHECRANLVKAHGPSGNERMMRLVVDGMKLSPANPTFVQARDALLQAALADPEAGPADAMRLWQGFAKRGLGYRAVAPPATSNTGLAESYEAPVYVTFIYPDGLPSRIPVGGPASFRVKMTGVNLELAPGSAALAYTVNGGPALRAPLSGPDADGVLTATIPAQPCFARVDYAVVVGTSAGERSDPPRPGASPARAFHAWTDTAPYAVLADGFDGPPAGWSIGAGSTAYAGQWTLAAPAGTPGAPAADHSPGGSMCFVTAGASVPSPTPDVDGGATILVSPAFDLSGRADAVVSYWRWYSNGTTGLAGISAYADALRVEVSGDDGLTWRAAETVGPGDDRDPDVAPGWRFAAWRLSDVGLAPTARVRVRFIAEDAGADSTIVAAVDDFAVGVLGCAPAAPCVAEFDGRAGVDLLDVFAFLDAWFAGSPRADVDRRAGVDLLDIFAFLEAWFTGC